MGIMTTMTKALSMAAVLLASAARADGPAAAPPATAPATPPASAPATPPASAAPAAAPATGSTAAVASTPGMVWGGLGFYGLGVTVSYGGFSASATSTNFGIHGGGEYNLLPLGNDLMLGAYADLALILASGTFVPITAGAALRYDKLPVHLLGGLGLMVLPHGGGDSTFPVGVGLLAMGSYPLPQVAPRLSANAQLGYNILSSGFSLWTFTIGAGYGF